MPYALPSPSTSPRKQLSAWPPSPASTTSSPAHSPRGSISAPSDGNTLAAPQHNDRPLRHHSRSCSSDSIHSLQQQPHMSFIYVQPASPDVNAQRPNLWRKSSGLGIIHQDSTEDEDEDDDHTPGSPPIPATPQEIEKVDGSLNQSDDDWSSKRQKGHTKSYSERSSAVPFKLDLSKVTGKAPSLPSNPPPGSRASTPMLRKKSGELVKSSLKGSSITKSAPSTPTTGGAKAVHFDTKLERVKLFLAQQRPAAVSRDGSPVETETEDDSEAFPFPPMTTSIPSQITLKLPNFHPWAYNLAEHMDGRDVGLDSIEIAGDHKSLKGIAIVRNLSFHKRVVIRFTFDDWQTVSEVSAEYVNTIGGGQFDRWSFQIKLQDVLARIEERKMLLAVRYTVDGRELWDNNYHQDYRIEFERSQPKTQNVVGGSRAARHQWSVTNPGQASERMADLRRELDRLVSASDDDDERSPKTDTFRFARPNSSFAGRYDFAANLKSSSARSFSSPDIPTLLNNPYFAPINGPIQTKPSFSTAFVDSPASAVTATGVPFATHARTSSVASVDDQIAFPPKTDLFPVIGRPPSPPFDSQGITGSPMGSADSLVGLSSSSTSVESPASPQSPIISMAATIATKPAMDSLSYFNFVQKYCWNGDSASTTGFGLSGPVTPTTASGIDTTTPRASCSTSFLSTPRSSGSSTPSSIAGTPLADQAMYFNASSKTIQA